MVDVQGCSDPVCFGERAGGKEDLSCKWRVDLRFAIPNAVHKKVSSSLAGQLVEADQGCTGIGDLRRRRYRDQICLAEKGTYEV